MGHPTIYPTGVTVYDPERSWNGFTIFQAQEVGAVLMDMNGREVNVWKGVHGMPNKIFPGGYLLTSRGRRSGKYSVQDGLDVIQVDWDGNIVWKFDRNEYHRRPRYRTGRWMARQHHDFQREGKHRRLLRARHGAQDRLRPHACALRTATPVNPKISRQAASATT